MRRQVLAFVGGGGGGLQECHSAPVNKEALDINL